MEFSSAIENNRVIVCRKVEAIGEKAGIKDHEKVELERFEVIRHH